jgi:hypothetical protein
MPMRAGTRVSPAPWSAGCRLIRVTWPGIRITNAVSAAGIITSHHRRLRDHPAFAAMQTEHERLHRFAARMLRAAAAAAPVSPDDFDHYVAARENMLFELDSLRREIRGFLGSRDTLTGAHRRLDLLAELRELLELSRRGSRPAASPSWTSIASRRSTTATAIASATSRGTAASSAWV